MRPSRPPTAATITGAERAKMYLHQQPNWPVFSCEMSRLSPALDSLQRRLADLAHSAELTEHADPVNPDFRQELLTAALTSELTASCAIEGERLDKNALQAALCRLAAGSADAQAQNGSDSAEEAAAELMWDICRYCREPLTHERLFYWHKLLLPDDHRNQSQGICAGAYRSSRMQVISGTVNHVKVHYEAVPPEEVFPQMDRFLHAINSGQPDLPPVVRAAAAHLWFVTIHPFDDGNGRLARAITQLLLWRDNLPPLLIMSPDIHKSGRSYYQILERTQQGSLDISE